MATQDFATSLEVLEDGQVKVITIRKNVIYLQPVIIVDSYLSIENLEVKGSRNEEVRVNVSNIKTIDNIAFTGAFEDLETALRELALNANGLLNGGVSGGGGSDPATATAQQDQTDLLNDLSDDTKRRVTGKVIELANDTGGNWIGFPLELAEIIIYVNGVGTSYPLNDVESTNSKDLAQQLSIAQSVLSFDYIEGSDEIVFNGVSSSSVEITGVTLEDNNSGTLEYSGFVDSVDMATGSVQQLVLLAQKNGQQTKQLIESNPVIDKTISLSYAGNLEYNLTADADIDGKTIPLGSFGDISSIQDLDAGNVNYRFDSGTPSASYPTINGNRAFDKLTNVDFNTFRIKAGAGGAAYTIIINLYK